MITIQRGERTEHPSPPFSYLDYVDLRDGATTLSGLLAYHDDYLAITGSGKPERIYGALTSANYFEVLGVKPILGRTLANTAINEREGAPEAVLGYDLWMRRFGGDPNVVGKTIEINLHTYTVVGVAPRGFQGCKTGLRTEFWIPLGMDRQVWGSTRIDERGQSYLNVLGVLGPGVSSHQAENELNLLMQRIVERYPESHQGDNRISTDPLWRSPVWRQCISVGNPAHPAGAGRGAVAAGLRQRGQSSAGALRRAPPRVRNSPFHGRKPRWRWCASS